MNGNTFFILVPALLVWLTVSLAGSVFAGQEEGKKVTVEGNIVCLIPDYQKGTVNPVIATGPCNELPPHHHLLVSKDGKVYTLQGLDQGIKAIETNPHRTNVKITGRAQENPGGWVLFLE
jgi:hypothetical protein